MVRVYSRYALLRALRRAIRNHSVHLGKPPPSQLVSALGGVSIPYACSSPGSTSYTWGSSNYVAWLTFLPCVAGTLTLEQV